VTTGLGGRCGYNAPGPAEATKGEIPMDASTLRGPAFVVGDNVDTDQIIPAAYLSYDPTDPAERRYFGRYALSGMPQEASGLPDGGVPFVPEGAFASAFAIVVAGRDFGCGSSREHAPLALAEAGVRAVVARGYARIFYRNSINGGYVLPLETDAPLPELVATGDDVEIDLSAGRLTDHTNGSLADLKPLGDAGQIVAAGGIFAYARQTGILPAR